MTWGGVLVLAVALYLAGRSIRNREQWVGGFKKDGENYNHRLDGLQDMLQATSGGLVSRLRSEIRDFRETRNKFQHRLISEPVSWKRIL